MLFISTKNIVKMRMITKTTGEHIGIRLINRSVIDLKKEIEYITGNNIPVEVVKTSSKFIINYDSDFHKWVIISTYDCK